MNTDRVWKITWDGTYGSGFGGNKQIANAADLMEVLQLRDFDGNAEFFIQREDMCEQLLQLHVTKSLWYLHYFPEGDIVPGFHSIGKDSDNAEMTHMPAGSNIYVPNYTLITSELAYQAAEEFVKTGTIPSCVEWFEL